MKKKKNKVVDPCIMICRASHWYIVRGVMTILLWIAFAASVCMKLFSGKGILASVLGATVAHSALLDPGSLLEVAKTLGICSLFIVWIYAELGKSELGRRYTELLSDYCKFYHLRALSYILAILACVYIAEAGTLESAGIAMFIAVLGLWDQVGVLVEFIFTPAVRKELAARQWERAFSTNQSPEKTSIEKNLSDLYVLADNISIDDEYMDRLCENMAKGILSYINKENEGNIITISHVWERLLRGRPNYEQFLVLQHMMSHIEKHLKKDQQMDQKRIFVCAGYLYWRFRCCTEPVQHGLVELSDDLLVVMSDIDLLYQKLHNEQKELMNCLNMLYALFFWMFFLCNKIQLTQEALEFFASYQGVHDDSCKDCVRLFARCTFSEETCKTYFDTAWNQVRKS